VAMLVEKLTSMTWCSCDGFRVRVGDATLILLNDSTSADGVQEYAVFREGQVGQIDSLSVSWMEKPSVEAAIVRCATDTSVFDAAAVPSLNHPPGACRHCL